MKCSIQMLLSEATGTSEGKRGKDKIIKNKPMRKRCVKVLFSEYLF